MNKFDKYINKKLQEDMIELPSSVKSRIELTLQDLPEFEENRNQNIRHRFATSLVCFVFVALFLLPNISITYAKAMEKIPVIGDFIRVITIRNYFYSDEMHKMNIRVPKIENENSDSFNFINREIAELSDIIMNKFYDDIDNIGNEGHSSVFVDYEVTTNTDYWFTLKIHVIEAAGSGNSYYKYYNLNKLTGKIISLEDLAVNNDFYKIIENDIKRQMIDKMNKDNKLIFWVNNSTFGDCVSIDSQHNYYWDDKGNLVIPFDKYEVAPGYIGTPEFKVNKKTIRKYMHNEFKDLLK